MAKGFGLGKPKKGNKKRQEAYLHLIVDLLQCPRGREPKILMAHRNLIDAGLVKMMGMVAMRLADEGDRESANFLINLANSLAEALGLSGTSVEFPHFLLQMTLAMRSNGNPETVYPILQAYLEQDHLFIQRFRSWLTDRLLYDADPDLALDYALVLTSFASVIAEFLLGDRAQNVEEAIACHQTALQVITRDTNPKLWGDTQNALAITYCNRIKGDQAENLENAIDAFEKALQVLTREVSPEQWSKIQNNLGNAYRDRIWGDKAENLERAIAAHQNALQVRTREVSPEKWAMTQLNLGADYRKRLKGDKAENLEMAIACYQQALQVYTSQKFPKDWADVHNNLGNVYLDREQFSSAISCYRAALEIFTPTDFPQSCFRTGASMGYAAFQTQLWSEAIEGYSLAIEAVETSRTWASSESRRQEILEEAIEVYENLVQACINAGQLEKAIETVERSRSKRLVDLMASNDLYQSGEIPPEVKELLQQFDDLQQRIDQKRSSFDSGNDRELMGVGTSTLDRAAFQAYNEAIASLEAEKQQIWEQLRRLDPVLAGEIQVSTPDFSAMQKLIDQPTTAILSFYTTSNDTYIFVLRQNGITLHTCRAQGTETLQSWIFQNWLKPYIEDGNAWNSQISVFLSELAQRLQINDLISQHLGDITELILVPHLALHQIPLAALPIGNGQYLGDKFLIRYTPSCQVLEFCKERGEVTAPLTYGIIEDATEDLPFASFEGEQIAQLYNIPESDRLKGRSQCTKSNYRQLASRVQVLHSSHHAQSRLDEPLESILQLAGETITLGELLTPGWRLRNLSDVFLSCCETGLGVFESLTDDILTLSTGFLCAGARNVVSSLWSVSDIATAIFSIFYYQHRYQGKSRSESLQQAQIELRQLNKEELLNREDIKELSRQAEAGRKEARNKRSQYESGSADYLKWDREYRKYASATNQIHTVKNSQDKEPFSHPRYWAAFTCSGLR
ncbi:MAG TPA: CHAT domain-containing tetratricopeptide repeat protein [Leptolyngbyaceae cyanobacterium]